ncbi:MAG: peroxiredoxin-like family protein [Saprospiraceae bacterium]|nr:AhpC/TSA family protein [Lewinellaceae bacterium]
MKGYILSALITLAATAMLHAQQLPEKPEDISPLLIGETMPNSELAALDGKTISFHDIAKEKPTVLIVYRGGWCPYCNRHLAAIGQSEAEILELGYQIVAISPDKAEKLRETAEKDSIRYRLFSDGDGAFAKAAGLAFQAPQRYGERLLDWSGGKNTDGYLPVPAIFVLDRDAAIQFEYINPDYKKRLPSEILLAVLKALQAAED